MDLNWVKLQGYKRLVSTTLNTSGKVVAIVGSNEAGKSSILQALQHLNPDNKRRFQANELNRGNDSQKDEDVVIKAGFLLDDNDRKAISHLFQGRKVRQFKLIKLLNGTRKWEIIPKPNRIAKQYNGDLKNLSELSQELTDPYKEIEEILTQRVPRILFFDEAQRDLKSTYELSKLASFPPPALRNLASLAKLDLVSLHATLSAGDQAKVQTLLKKANVQITNVVKDKWSQSKVKVSLSTNGSTLHVHIENEQLDCTSLEDRSDGLRQFVALINFLESEHADQRPILLIDEAETHLHYDAQADLMNMFAEQQLAAKIIYTTHSAGCLPEDLGNGVRCVLPIKGKEESKIENNFWAIDKQDKRAGFSPLLFSMGASSLAFIPIRKAVFVEGATDMLLLPTMLRQVSNKSYLGFQIAPGLSETKNSFLRQLKNEAPTVAFLVDNDKAGKKLSADLKGAEFDESQIFSLPGVEGCVLEDCIRKELYLEAVNKVLQDWNQNVPIMLLEELPDINRPKAVEDWCKDKKTNSPDKKNIAYCLLDFATGERQEFLVKEELRQSFKKLHDSIVKCLAIENPI
ncbi:ATP-dependent nuclease [Pseudanabaena mucicola]|uniref:AAA family ATPase n=1 Tax=Pseudanabaena mucicola FACHB-723 TaxID=2692860 RepID=A0ABR7ZTI1_9CYAN|nr:AAA family ATPase [Pseudanabaena mucicola]MBD2187067.1 AAA family ATPase [Pseudanabaena mucicola FACHB-723]